mmetsp:Transcript_67176/g.200662  ORF Transcript_67176/g.200662 Transcript_67176/m.200662 type:complete len:261 (-) Transcript_67176:1387-2169(-)
MRKLLEEKPRPKRGDDERLGAAGREALHALLGDDPHHVLSPLRVAKPPKLAAVAVALAQVRDGVVEVPLAVEHRAAAAHVRQLLPHLGVQLFERVVVGVVHVLQPLRDELVRVQVERLQQRLLERDRRAQVAVVLERVLGAHHLNPAPPLRRARRHAARLDDDGAHAGSQRNLERLDLQVALEQRVHARDRVAAARDRVEDGQPRVGLIEVGVERAPLGEQAAVEHRRRLLLRLAERVRHLVRRERAVPNPHLGDVALKV